jgi:AAA15 family ATPase/GTPase
MAITRIRFKNFTAFNELDLGFTPGINAFVGANGTGKTHIMKVIHAACDISKTKLHFGEKLIRDFLPSGRALGRLVKRKKGSNRSLVEVHRDNLKLRISFSNHSTKPESAKVIEAKPWMAKPIESVFIPVKEMLANAPGFRSLYAKRDIHFEEIYADILDRAYMSPLKGQIDKTRKSLLTHLQKVIEGKVETKDEEFFLRNKYGNLEFSLVAEGLRKLGLLWLLIQNGTLYKGSVLFWDEPEANLNPKLFGILMEILLKLQKIGVQIFFATHDYVILKELDLRRQKSDQIAFYSLYRNKEDGEIRCQKSLNYLDIDPNVIAETYTSLYDREVEKNLEGLQQ